MDYTQDNGIQGTLLGECSLMKKSYGKLKVMRIIPPTLSGNRVTMAECKCSCGKLIHVSVKHLEKGLRKSCGCRGKKIITRYQASPKVIARDNLLPDSPLGRMEKEVSDSVTIGDMFGELKVLDYAGVSAKRYHLFVCKCTCKNREIVHGLDLVFEGKTTCGSCDEDKQI